MVMTTMFDVVSLHTPHPLPQAIPQGPFQFQHNNPAAWHQTREGGSRTPHCLSKQLPPSSV